MRDRTDEFLSYAHRFPLGDPRQLLGLALRLPFIGSNQKMLQALHSTKLM